MEFVPTIGLEIHAELKTRTKMFCDSANDPDETLPNVNVCPICLGHPGTLPTINQEAVRQVLRVGLAVRGQLADFTEFDRKNYFYPDLPKGYQISQYKYPLVSGGVLNGITLTRIHLEEDTARSIHDEVGGTGSLIDFNRAGVPLMELVTEPVIKSAARAGAFAREFQLLLRYLGVSEANLEKGELRVEANISVSPRFDLKKNPEPKVELLEKLGTKVEVKNLNSFRALERAIEYEIERQQKLLSTGGSVIQETRGWDEHRGLTYSQRVKESAHDYRYFPEPDLPKLKISEIAEWQNLIETIPELPWQRRERLAGLGIASQDVEQYVIDSELAEFFSTAAGKLSEPKMIKVASNLIANLIAGERRKRPGWLPALEHFVETVRLNGAGELPMSQTKSSILAGVLAEVATAESLVALTQKLIIDNPKVIADYRAGKESALQYLVGQGMKETKGTANPEVLKKFLLEALVK